MQAWYALLGVWFGTECEEVTLMATEDSIPVVDFKGVSSCQDLATCPQVQQLHSAFTKVGFVFIKNHGIDRKLVG